MPLPTAHATRVTVADLIADGLARAGTPRVFTAGEDADAGVLRVACERRGLPLIGVAGPAAACTMAAVTGDLVGVPGAVIARHEAAGVLDALARAGGEAAPLLVLDGRLPGVLPPGIKASVVLEVDSAAHWIAHAAQLAMTDPRGPVHIVIPPGVAGRPAVPVTTSPRLPGPPAPAARVLDEAADRLAGASRPLIIAGAHCRWGETPSWLRALAEALPAPVLVTARGRGALPDPHPLRLGAFTGDAGRDPLLARADLVVALGLDPLESAATRAIAARRLRLGATPDPAPVGPVDLDVVGDLALVLQELAPRLRGRPRADWDVAELDRVRRQAAGAPPAMARGLARRRVVELLREVTPAGTLAVITPTALDDGAGDDGAAEAWQAVGPGELLAWRGDAGFALPAAIAAQLVHPGRRVVAVTTSDDLRRVAEEIETVARLRLPLVVVTLDTASTGGGDDLRQLATRHGWGTTAAAGADVLSRAMIHALAQSRPWLIRAQDGSV